MQMVGVQKGVCAGRREVHVCVGGCARGCTCGQMGVVSRCGQSVSVCLVPDGWKSSTYRGCDMAHMGSRAGCEEGVQVECDVRVCI